FLTLSLLLLAPRPPPRSTLFPYTTLFRSGVGKSTLFQTVLGQRALTRGTVEVAGRIGYIPQQRMFPANLPIRARDLVGLSTAHGVFRNRRPQIGRAHV